MSKEIWKPIKGYEGYYSVSNKGRVKSFARKGAWHDRIMKLQKYKKGYLYVHFSSPETKPKKFKVHRLVISAFKKNPKNLPDINHLDGDKTNNNSWNLKWTSKSNNTQHMCYVLGKTVIPVVICYPNGKEISYNSIRQAGRKMKFNSSTLAKMLKNQIKKDYGFKIKKGVFSCDM